jgi:hypothetical protein
MASRLWHKGYQDWREENGSKQKSRVETMSHVHGDSNQSPVTTSKTCMMYTLTVGKNMMEFQLYSHCVQLGIGGRGGRSLLMKMRDRG